jgi:hypothetical protein
MLPAGRSTRSAWLSPHRPEEDGRKVNKTMNRARTRRNRPSSHETMCTPSHASNTSHPCCRAGGFRRSPAHRPAERSPARCDRDKDGRGSGQGNEQGGTGPQQALQARRVVGPSTGVRASPQQHCSNPAGMPQFDRGRWASASPSRRRATSRRGCRDFSRPAPLPHSRNPPASSAGDPAPADVN